MRRWSRRNRSSRGRVPRTDPDGKLSQLSADPQAPRPRPVVRSRDAADAWRYVRELNTHVVRRILGARESRVGRASRGRRHPRPRNYCVPHTGTRRVVESAGPVSIEFGAVRRHRTEQILLGMWRLQRAIVEIRMWMRVLLGVHSTQVRRVLEHCPFGRIDAAIRRVTERSTCLSERQMQCLYIGRGTNEPSRMRLCVGWYNRYFTFLKRAWKKHSEISLNCVVRPSQIIIWTRFMNVSLYSPNEDFGR